MINLSYVISTYNKLPYLKISVSNLLKSVEEDEEIIIIDGGSTDGTKEYIETLYNNKQISLSISEKDKGEAHGYNKGILLSKGILIKILSDDDAYSYSVIKTCKKYMLSNPEIDIIGGNTGSGSIDNRNSLCWNEDFHNDFIKWKNGELNRFFFNGTCLMIRRSSLSLIGLVDSNTLLADMEYTLRITGIANLAWCTGIISVRILNPQSNNLVFKQRAIEESIKLCSYYNYKYPWERTKEELRKRSLYRKARSLATKIKIKLMNKNEKLTSLPQIPFSDFEEAHGFCNDWLKNHPKNQNIQFYCK